jgi:DNA-binding MurR/RpiR family transcriptional regulator
VCGVSQTIVEKLREGLDGFPATERRVAHQLLAEYPVAGLQSATDLARAVAVSAPTVLRLVGRLGFGSYMDFQRSLRDELSAQLSSPLAKQPPPVRRSRGGTEAPLPAHAEFSNAILANLQETFASVPPGEFAGVVQLLSDPRARIHLIGGRFTDALALYLSVQLRILRPGVRHLQEQESNWRDQLLDMGKRDVLVMFDIRRYQPSLQRLAHAAPIVRVATHVLSARIAVPSVWDSSTALMALSEWLLAEVSRQGWDKSRRRIEELEQMQGGERKS